MVSPPDSPAVVDDLATVRKGSDGGWEVVLRGRLDGRAVAVLARELPKRLGGQTVGLRILAEDLEDCDGAGVAWLRLLNLGAWSGGAPVEVVGLRPVWRRVFDAVSPEDLRVWQDQKPGKPHVVADVGRAGSDVAGDLRDQVAFTGEAALGLLACLPRPRAMRWGEVARVFEVAGADALPIVALISLLVGLIIAFSAVQPLAQFGAELYIANMIGLIMVRELGPIMTAILLAGRSGSAFAAELGTMKVNEELNALVTMGLDPMRFLVLQRIVAGVLLTPLLTVYSMLMGILGGVLVMLAIGFPLAAIWTQLVSSLLVRDVLVGVVKGVVFGVLVAGIGCLRGLQTRQGPSAVGQATTRAVVSGILLIIVADALFAVLLHVLGV